MSEGKTNFERVVGGNEEQKHAVLGELQGFFDLKSEILGAYELQKTQEEIQTISLAESAVDGIVKEYGGNPQPLPLDHVYVLEPGSVVKLSNGKAVRGTHNPLGSKIAAERSNSSLLFAGTVVHELLHIKSYKSARFNTGEQEADLYRTGLVMVGEDENEYFRVFEEAVVAECSRICLEELQKKEPFSHDAAATREIQNLATPALRASNLTEDTISGMWKETKLIPNPVSLLGEILNSSKDSGERGTYAAKRIMDLYKEDRIEFTERWKERREMYNTLDDLAAKSEGRFKNRTEIFDKFARANFTGNYLPLARIVEAVLGKGSFRKMALDFSDR